MTKTIETEVLGVLAEAAILRVRLPLQTATRSLVWEVAEPGELEPLRYGLCLIEGGGREAEVAVTGLRPGTAYEFRFSDGEACTGGGRFETRWEQGQRAA